MDLYGIKAVVVKYKDGVLLIYILGLVQEYSRAKTLVVRTQVDKVRRIYHACSALEVCVSSVRGGL